MTNAFKQLTGIGIVLISLLLFAPYTHAATLFLTTKSTQVEIGDKVEVDIIVSSEDAGFNAAQATLQFPNDILEVVSVDKSKSPFTFWLTEPTFSNEEGTVIFAGGNGIIFSGKGVEILKVFFKVKGAGTANLTLADGAVTAGDGSDGDSPVIDPIAPVLLGSDILSAVEGLTLSSSVPSPSQSSNRTLWFLFGGLALLLLSGFVLWAMPQLRSRLRRK